MVDYTPADRIEVSASAMPSQLMSLLRDAVGLGTAWAIGAGYIDAATGTQIVGFMVIVGNVIWRQYVTRRTHSKLVTAADAAPASVAVVR